MKKIVIFQSSSKTLDKAIELIGKKIPESECHLIVTSQGSQDNPYNYINKVIQLNATKFEAELLNEKEKEILSSNDYKIGIILCNERFESKYKNVLELAKKYADKVVFIEGGTKYISYDWWFKFKAILNNFAELFFKLLGGLFGVVLIGIFIVILSISWGVNKLRYKLSCCFKN